MSSTTDDIRLGADIGGTFTDIALDLRGTLFSTKVLTNYAAPEQAILDGVAIVTRDAGIAAVRHRHHHPRHDAGDQRADRAPRRQDGVRHDGRLPRRDRDADREPLRAIRPESSAADAARPARATASRSGAASAREGQELQPLDEAALEEIADRIAAGGFGAVAVGFIHSYANPSHERRAREILAREGRGCRSRSASEVSPQMREFERFNTVCANAYVRPQMADYLARLQTRLQDMGADCPVFMIHSGGGLISVETASEFPVRLVESGPAGGAIFAADIARRFGLEKVVSYDMGGTTAKICLIEDYAPRTARTFEVARTYRFCKGSGMPISIPVIEMIEIGAGGGSIAWVDAMGRIQTGPESAGSEPGPACYRRGGQRPAITDADLVLGKLDPDNFAGGAIRLSTCRPPNGPSRAMSANGCRSTLTSAAFGICEVVDENMANAARVHAVENGKNISDNIMIAFGGAAPLHAARLCEKLGIDRCLVPQGAGVGSAIGFLKAPFGYEALASQAHAAVAVRGCGGQRAPRRAEGFRGELRPRPAPAAPSSGEITAFMRYAGQGWEIPVAVAGRAVRRRRRRRPEATGSETNYQRFFGRAIDGLEDLEIEIVTWSVKARDDRPPSARHALTAGTRRVLADRRPAPFSIRPPASVADLRDRRARHAGRRRPGQAARR